jgi:hypothetical protein
VAGKTRQGGSIVLGRKAEELKQVKYVSEERRRRIKSLERQAEQQTQRVIVSLKSLIDLHSPHPMIVTRRDDLIGELLETLCDDHNYHRAPIEFALQQHFGLQPKDKTWSQRVQELQTENAKDPNRKFEQDPPL